MNFGPIYQGIAAATSDDAKLETLYDEIRGLEKRVQPMKRKIWDYDMDASNSAFPLAKTIFVLILLSYGLLNIYKRLVVPCASYHMPMFMVLMSVFAVIFIKVFISALVNILTAQNHANDMRDQMIDLRPHATLLRRELELFVEKTDATSMIYLQMDHITSMVDDAGYYTLTGSLRIDTVLTIFMMMFYTTYFALMMMSVFYDVSDLCSNAPTIALSRAGGFSHTIWLHGWLFHLNVTSVSSITIFVRWVLGEDIEL